MIVSIGSASFGRADPTPLHLLESAGLEVRRNPLGRRLDEAETLDHVREAHGWIAGSEPVSRYVLERCPHLKAVARIGVGLSSVDLDAAAELGVRVSRTPDAPTNAVAELTLGALLALNRRLIPMTRDVFTWTRHLGRDLAGQSVLVIGYGRIGRRVAELLRAFRAEVRVVDPAVPESVSLFEGLTGADVVCLHASTTDTILDRAAFSAMKDGTLVLSAGRGAQVDEAALLDALDSGRVGGAWLDVFSEEPYTGPLLEHERVLATPHAATFTRGCRLQMEVEAAQNLIRDLRAD